MIYFFIKGLLFGCYSAAIPGPIGMICIKRTLENSKSSGIASAFGVVTAETFYACITIYGLTFISTQFYIENANFLFLWKSCLQILGSLFLLHLGYTTFFSRPDTKIDLGKKQNLLSDYISITFLTLIHPMLVINFVIIFASFGFNSPNINF
jgi:threonine/homoserine/homoserine lactone efflux protein